MIVGFVRLYLSEEVLLASKSLFIFRIKIGLASFFIMGKFFASITSCLVFLCGSESFPTECRTMGTTLAQTVCRLMMVILVIILQSKKIILKIILKYILQMVKMNWYGYLLLFLVACQQFRLIT